MSLADPKAKTLTTTICENECHNPAAYCCVRCDSRLCEECFDALHSVPVLKKQQHAKVAIDEVPNNVPLCTKHGKEQELYCLECQRLVCYLCSTHGDHKQHQCELLSDALEKLKKDLTQGATDLETCERQLVKAVSSVEATIKQVKQVAFCCILYRPCCMTLASLLL
jgi:hypothetical protein